MMISKKKCERKGKENIILSQRENTHRMKEYDACSKIYSNMASLRHTF